MVLARRPPAVTHDGLTHVGWVDHEGDIKLSSYDHSTGDRVTATLQARLNEDDHANPSSGDVVTQRPR